MPVHHPLSTTKSSEIRVVKLFPGGFGDKIRCELEHVSLESKGHMPFAAVSYRWGNPDRTKRILLDGQNYLVTGNLFAFLQHASSILLNITQYLPAVTQKRNNIVCELLTQHVVHRILQDPELPIDILVDSDSRLQSLVKSYTINFLTQSCDRIGTAQARSSLDSVLRALDNTSKPPESDACFLRLWIDALCINQQDITERNQQVSLMRKIYSNSATLLIWPLDVTSPLSPLDMKMTAELVRKMYTTGESYNDGTTDLDLYSMLSPTDSAAIHRLAKFFTQPWFSRMWIIQEVVVATGPATLLLGFFPISWRLLTGVVLACCKWTASVMDMSRLQFTLTRNSRCLAALRDLEREFRHLKDMTVAERLQQLLQQTRGLFEATEPHDCLYALLGLLGTGSLPREMYPDYSTPFEQVFHQYTVYLINNTGDISLLQCTKRELSGVPSWVPDWRFATGKQNILSYNYLDSPHVSVTRDKSCLEMDGILLGRVVAVAYSPHFEVDMTRPVNARILTIVQAVQKLKEACIKSIELNALAKSISSFQQQWENFWSMLRKEEYRSLWEMFEGTKEVDPMLLNESYAPTVLSATTALLQNMSRRGVGVLSGCELVSTTEVDGHIQTDDVVCLFNRISAPCILRPKDSHYSFVSVCSLSSFQKDIAEKRRFEDFEVRRFVLV